MAEMLNFTFIVEEPVKALFLWVIVTYTSQVIMFVMPCTTNSEYMQFLPLGLKWVEFWKAVGTDVSEEG
jgi:hypothetical protein